MNCPLPSDNYCPPILVEDVVSTPTQVDLNIGPTVGEDKTFIPVINKGLAHRENCPPHFGSTDIRLKGKGRYTPYKDTKKPIK